MTGFLYVPSPLSASHTFDTGFSAAATGAEVCACVWDDRKVSRRMLPGAIRLVNVMRDHLNLAQRTQRTAETNGFADVAGYRKPSIAGAGENSSSEEA